ncbi:AbrB/MazE/SpoVT family DNA-binding domain-containing protein [Paenibacillus sp. MZ04-78.2]|uniref:AbrB/MazE/SpoVT family DNA-binding domain-containing protein n=1 Tax=Paenibacillus sp. MZ04-78.2 TaxID=2962034 RepID=UPI0020B7659A|nr:AbrB/MazE/SpoVT family DNA-binding domain-containing protein [Paenibacillus sp. MZ04-78.2]MCP3773130.1 AbrB/MazE/SpoVT family DNA-binding domain-containing protein [Paenibacillus sp. MZ04-78.2]
MRKTGIVRHVDHLGRLNLPIELQRTLSIGFGDAIEFFVDDEKKQVLIRKYRAEECIFCSSTERLVFFRGRFICWACLKTLPGNNEPLAGMKRKRNKDTRLLLASVMKQYPSASQTEWGHMIGVSQGWISQLLKQLK